MPDEFNSWENTQPNPADKARFAPRSSGVKLVAGGRNDNPYKREEARDRVIFFWVMGALLVLLLLGALVFSGVLMSG